MERPKQYTSGYFIPELIEDEDIIFNKDSEYHKQKKKEKKNPIFKRNKSKNRWAIWGGSRMIPKFRAWDRTRNEMNYSIMVGNCDTEAFGGERWATL